jgi:hypothetical protein
MIAFLSVMGFETHHLIIGGTRSFFSSYAMLAMLPPIAKDELSSPLKKSPVAL